MNFAALPDLRAEQHPHGACLADDDAVFDNRGFAEMVRRGAGALAARGVAAGDVVAVMLPNISTFVVALFAAWRLGAAVTPVNPVPVPAEAGYQVADADARVLIIDNAGSAEVAAPAVLTARELTDHAPSTCSPVQPAGDALALLIYTSGTTGRPKGVMLDHANVAAMCDMIVDAMRLTDADHSLLILPLFHANGIMAGTLSPLLAGGQVTIAGRFSPKTFFDRVERSRATYFSAVPAIYTMLADLPAEVQPATSSVRFAVCGAASPGQRRVARKIPEPLRHTAHRGLRALRGNLREHHQPARRCAQTGDGGWLHTGDIGRLDDDGCLTLVDRTKDMIIRGGENIYPKEIEAVRYGLPEVAEAAVVGRPSPVYGEEPVLFVALNTGADLDVAAIAEFARKNLAKYKQPVEITICDELPKNPVGKIDKPAA